LHEIIVIGSLNMDLVVSVDKMPELGETIRGSELLTIPGGKGANQAAAIALLGKKVRLVGRVGKDLFGSKLIANLDSLGVDTKSILQDETSETGTAVITVDAQGNNSIIISPGANGKVSEEDVQRAEPLIKTAKLLLLQLEIPLNTVMKAIEIACQNKVPVVLNLSPILQLSGEVLKKIDYLIVNEVEANSVSDIQVKDVESAKKASQSILALGVKNIIVTLGENGAVLANKNLCVHVPSIKVTPVDSTAAGDAFIGGMITGLLNGLSLPDAVRYGNCAGAITTTRKGAQTSLPTNSVVEELFRSSNQEPNKVPLGISS
jgi:ribokinase